MNSLTSSIKQLIGEKKYKDAFEKSIALGMEEGQSSSSILFLREIQENSNICAPSQAFVRLLSSTNSKDNMKAARGLFKEARKEFSWDRAWLGCPGLLDVVIAKVYEYNTKGKLVNELMGFLSTVSRPGRYTRYNKIFQVFGEVLKENGNKSVVYAANGLGHSNSTEKWKYFLQGVEIQESMNNLEAIIDNFYLLRLDSEIPETEEIVVKLREIVKISNNENKIRLINDLLSVL
ncbi:MAG: hypothetical protein AAGG75_28795 [Bacteroidota bacterium]